MGNKTQIETEIGWDLDLDLYDLVASRQRQNMIPAALQPGEENLYLDNYFLSFHYFHICW